MRCPGVLLALLVFLVMPSVLKAQECAPLDPRQQIEEKITHDVDAAAQTAFKVGHAEGKYKDISEKVVKNLYEKYPGADKIVLKSQLIYLFCTTLKESSLSSERKMKELNDFITSIQDIKGEA